MTFVVFSVKMRMHLDVARYIYGLGGRKAMLQWMVLEFDSVIIDSGSSPKLKSCLPTFQPYESRNSSSIFRVSLMRICSTLHTLKHG